MKLLKIAFCLILALSFFGCPGESDDDDDDNGGSNDYVVTLGPDQSDQTSCTATDNGDGSWNLAWGGAFGWYQRNVGEDRSVNTTVELDISCSAANQVKLDMQDSTGSIFNNSDDNWVTLTGGDTRETITYNLSTKATRDDIALATLMADLQSVVLQNHNTTAAFTLYSITLK
ncbi:MAG: hypothetical protein JXJ04_11465 [Spirochaetales bacterium]|nr:hypothetical protein [Spirochaetales bacterium]